MNLKAPIQSKVLYGTPLAANGSGHLPEEKIGYEYWAIGMPTRIINRARYENILLEKPSPWEEIFRNVYVKQIQTGQNKDIERYMIPLVLKEEIGEWEGFVTSFMWEGIKFVSVWVHIIVGKEYYLPKSLIKEIDDKIKTRVSRIDMKEISNLIDSTEWNPSSTEAKELRQKFGFGAESNFGIIPGKFEIN